MENEENLPREPGSIDSNVAYEESQRSREDQLKSFEPVQVSSLPPVENELLDLKGSSKEKEDTKSPKESIDIDSMNQQLREKHKEASENWSEKDSLSQECSNHPGTVGPDENLIYERALSCVPGFLGDILYPHQIDISKVLNPERGDQRNYRLVAHYLGFPTTFISIVSEAQNPMIAIFERGLRLKGKDLVEALFKCRRFDAMEHIVKNYFSEKLMHSMSQEEKRAKFKDGSTITGSLEEKLVLEDRFRASSDPSSSSISEKPRSSQPIRMATTPHEESRLCEDDADWANAVPGAKEFWERIPSVRGTAGSKKLKDVREAFNALFKSDEYKTEFPYTWKLIVHTFDLDGKSGDQLVKTEMFKQMLAFFGPPTADQDGCIKTAGELRIKSQRKRKSSKSKVSWFAGRMDQDEAERQLENEKPGTFLIRFSTSHAENGWFVLAIKTENAGVVQFQIEQNQSEEGRVFNISQEEKEFSSLWDLVEYYEVNPLVDENEELRVYLEYSCPGLPLNAICTGYRKGKGKK